MNRPPIVTVMGHVDHGKTTLLDALRGTKVVEGESGGITQHTGASQVEHSGNKITFIDTPGHEAFTEMRARGGKVADIVILVVAANDGVMPQTKEAISHAQAANIPIIVAINKIDLPDKNLPRIKGQLTEQGLNLEEYGGDVMCVEVSATQNIGLEKLLESIVTLSEFIENKDSEDGDLKGFVLEGYHDSKRGVVVNAVVTNGILNKGDEIVVANKTVAKIRNIQDSKGENVQNVIAGDPAELLGFKDLPEPGEQFIKYTGQELDSADSFNSSANSSSSSDDLEILVRADTQGTLEAIKASLEKLEHEGRKVKFLLADIGDLKESDILLASVSNAIVLCFKVKVPSKVQEMAEKKGLILRQYDVIYEMIEEIEGALEGMQEMAEEKVKGRAIIEKLFTLPSGDVVAGVNVLKGRLRVGDSVSIRTEEDAEKEVFKSKIKNLQFGRDQINTVGKDKECGMMIVGNFDKLLEGYIIEVL